MEEPNSKVPLVVKLVEDTHDHVRLAVLRPSTQPTNADVCHQHNEGCVDILRHEDGEHGRAKVAAFESFFLKDLRIVQTSVSMALITAVHVPMVDDV